jgi:hypothetical protein
MRQRYEMATIEKARSDIDTGAGLRENRNHSPNYRLSVCFTLSLPKEMMRQEQSLCNREPIG